MTRKALAPVPDPEPVSRTVTVAVAGGKVTMSVELSGEDFLALYQLSEVDTEDASAMLKLYGPIMGMIERHCISHTFDNKPILRRPVSVLQDVWKAWNEAMREQALDPTSASD